MKKIILFITIGLFTLGCTTKSVWNAQGKGTKYSETIFAFYSNSKEKNIAFLGNKYHYIFTQNTEDFNKLLNKRKFIHLSQKNLKYPPFFSVQNENNKLFIKLYMQFNEKNLNKEQKSLLYKYNFRLKRGSFGNFYERNYVMEGKRYLGNPKVNKKAIKMQEPIELKVTLYKQTENATLGKIALTPLSLGVDALIQIGEIIYTPVGWLNGAI